MRTFMLLFTIVVNVSCQSQSSNYLLDPQSFDAKVKSTSNAVVLDVRTKAEFEGGFIANAVNVDFNSAQFESDIEKLDKSKTYFVYCLSGGRSSQAAQMMREQHFAKVYELKGGIMAWKNKNFSLVTSSTPQPAADQISMSEYLKLSNSDKLVLIDFYAPWCVPCKQMAPILDEIAAEYKGTATIIRINIDENKSLVQALKIDEIPFFKLYKNGNEAGNYIGQMDKASFKRILVGK